MFKQVLVTLLLTSTSLSYAASLNAQEQQIIDYAAASKEKQIALLAKLVNINSGTANIAGVIRVGEILRPQFKALGFTTRWVYEPANMHRAPTLIAERHGTQGKRVLLIGHLDTVSQQNAPVKFIRHEHTASGAGTSDDKGGDVIILFALKALHAAHALTNTNITVVLTGDEEESGKPTSISRRPLFDAANKSDIALDFENALTLDSATVARRGIGAWSLKTQGLEAHSAAIFRPEAGDGAIFEMTRILNTMRTELSNEQYLTFNPGLIVGGTTVNYNPQDAAGKVFGKGNVIAQAAFAQGDLRFLSEEQKLSAQKKIQAIVSQHLPGTEASIEFQNGIPAMTPSPGNLALLKKYSEASVDLNLGEIRALDPTLRGAGDISHIAGIVPANLSGLGPAGEHAHSIKENVDLASLAIQTKRAALLLFRITRN